MSVINTNELNDKEKIQIFYDKIYQVFCETNEIAEMRRDNLPNSPRHEEIPAEAILVCLSHIKRDLISVLMILNIHINSCFDNKNLICDEKIKEKYFYGSVQ